MRSAGAIRTFWFFMLISIAVDMLWLFVYSPLRPIAWDTILSLSRKDQASLAVASTAERRSVSLPCPSQMHQRLGWAVT